jgi:hypothetical protein
VARPGIDHFGKRTDSCAAGNLARYGSHLGAPSRTGPLPATSSPAPIGLLVGLVDDFQVCPAENGYLRAMVIASEVLTDRLADRGAGPNEPPMPGKVSYEQARRFAQAFPRDKPDTAAIATTLFKDRIQQLRARRWAP